MIYAVMLFLVLLISTAAQAASAVLTWTDNSTNEQGFDIERKAEACAGTALAFSKIGAVAVNVKTYTDTTVSEGASYCYRVDAFNGPVKSGYSNTAGLTIPFEIPAGPSGLGVVAGP